MVVEDQVPLLEDALEEDDDDDACPPHGFRNLRDDDADVVGCCGDCTEEVATEDDATEGKAR